MPDLSSSIVYRPDPEQARQSHLHQFMLECGCETLDELQAKSVEDVAWFWDAMLTKIGVVFDEPYAQVMDDSAGPQRPRWCVGGRMNITKSLLDKWQATRGDAIALAHESEDGSTLQLSYRELLAKVESLAAGLRELGIKRGDVVAVLLPMTPECVISMLAILRVGGIFLPLFSGYGTSAVVSRLNDSQAKALITCDGFKRRGKSVNVAEVARESLGQSASVQTVIQHKYLEDGDTLTSARSFASLLESDPAGGAAEICDADEPCMLIYTSGTTGRPKGAVHTHCGFAVKATQDMLHGFDVHQDDVFFWITDMGWMMGPWLVYGTLAIGATMMTYDGALDVPGPDRVWDLAAKHKVTVLGLSPTLVRSLIPHGTDIVDRHDLSSLRAFCSTGEPWNPEPWMWLFENVGKGKLPIINYSGGTEISGGILCGNPMSPLKPCAFAGPLPGMDVDVLDASGEPVRGEVGELVIRKPWIGMTRGFWNDEQRYLDSYWSTYEGIWHHGDFATIDSDGLWFILGRSDDTIKVAGKRLGPAEAESVLVSHPRVKEAAAVGVPDDTKGQALVCMCVCTGSGDDKLAAELRKLVAAELGKPLTPKAILFVEDLPKTRNGKIMRRVAKSAYLGQDAGDLSALENPSAVDAIRAAAST